MKYYIGVVEHRSTVVEVEADNIWEAMDKAESAYNDNIICLDNGYEYVDDGTEFSDETDEWTELAEMGGTNFQKI